MPGRGWQKKETRQLLLSTRAPPPPAQPVGWKPECCAAEPRGHLEERRPRVQHIHRVKSDLASALPWPTPGNLRPPGPVLARDAPAAVRGTERLAGAAGRRAAATGLCATPGGSRQGAWPASRPRCPGRFLEWVERGTRGGGSPGRVGGEGKAADTEKGPSPPELKHSLVTGKRAARQRGAEGA